MTVTLEIQNPICPHVSLKKIKNKTKHTIYKLSMRLVCVLTFPVELQRSQQAHRFEHLCDVHLQTALQLDEEPTDLRVDFPVLWPEMAHEENKAYQPGGTW